MGFLFLFYELWSSVPKLSLSPDTQKQIYISVGSLNDFYPPFSLSYNHFFIVAITNWLC